MSKKPKYIEIELMEEAHKTSHKEKLEKYSVSRKINKSTNLEILSLIRSDPATYGKITDHLYRSNPSYEFWSKFRNFHKDDVKMPNFICTLRKILTQNDNFTGCPKNFEGLEYILEHEIEFVRPIETWSPRSRNATNQFGSLLKHLFTLYDTPKFLEKSFYTGDIEGIYMYLHLGKGKSMKNYDGYPVNMIIHKKAAHHLYTTPEDMNLYTALRRCQVLYMGGDDYIFKALMRSNQLRERIPVVRICKSGEKEFKVSFEHEEFWLSVMKFFIENTMIEPNKISEIVDYINHMKFVEINSYDEGRHHLLPPPHPNFTMKGRTPMSLLTQSDQWHYEKERLNRVIQQTNTTRWGSNKKIQNFNWVGRKINNGLFTRGKKYKYKVIQLLSYYDLRDEGNEMHHCVATYAASCNSGACAIFSVREYIDDLFVGRTATIEVRGDGVVQIRAKYNKKPDDTTMSVIREWSSYEMLGLSSYAL